MEKIEMVEKLREKADITMEEAKEVLERNDWDLLDAFIDLEKQRKLNSQVEEDFEEEAENAEMPKEEKHVHSSKLIDAAADLLSLGLDNKFVVRKGDKELFKVPVIVPTLCAAGSIALTGAALGAGLLLDLNYSLKGKDKAEKPEETTEETAEETTDEAAEEVEADMQESSEETAE